jgi:hypothetical protein
MMRRPAHCPRCGNTATVPIIYGYPTEELVAESDRGEVELGGCAIMGDDPRWHCPKCELDFSPPRRPRHRETQADEA